MKIFLFVFASIHILFVKGATREECSIIIVNVHGSQTINLLDGAGGEVMWLCTKDPGTVFTTTISLKSGSLSPLTPAFSLPDDGVWYNLTVGQANEFVPAYILVNGEKQNLGNAKIDYVDVSGECIVAWATCKLHGQCPLSSSTKTPSKSSSCFTSESGLLTTTTMTPTQSSSMKGAVPTLAILLVMALLIILLLSINNCRLMWLLRSKENLNLFSIGSESRLCQEHSKLIQRDQQNGILERHQQTCLLERHQQNGILQYNEKEKIQPKQSFQAVNTQLTMVQGVSTEDLTSVLSAVEINARREPEQNDLNERPTLTASQKFEYQTSALCRNPRQVNGKATYGSTLLV